MLSTDIYTKVLTDDEREHVARAVENIVYPEHDYRVYLIQIRLAQRVLWPILADLIERRNLSRGYPHHTGAIKIVNLPCDAEPPLPPAQPGGLKRITKPSYVSENILLLVATLFGSPYSMACEGQGLVNNLVPTRSTSADLTGAGAASDLRFHIENAALRFLTGQDCAPKALFLTGVRQEQAPPRTRLADARAALALLTRAEQNALATPQYRLRLPYRWRPFRAGYEHLMTAPVPLLEPAVDGLLVHAALYGDMIADYGSAAGEHAARSFEAALEAVAVDEIVAPGELLCIDNRVTLHARTPFAATFDTEGRARRWAQRVFVTDDQRNFHGWETGDGFVFSPRFAAPVDALSRAG
jgi:L-asparagine oxygenase